MATWNRGKGPIDVYSCFQKNCKSAHFHLGPVGAIWLRLITTCVYNAYHTYNLSRTVSYLMSDECKSFKNFQQSRARQPPFHQFCVELANDLKIEVVPPSMYESCSDNDGQMTIRRTDDGADNTSSCVVGITYNKREAYFCKLPLIERRKNGRLNHQLVTSVKRQSSCVWCCRIDHSTGQKHSRHGMKTTWKCSVCGVSCAKDQDTMVRAVFFCSTKQIHCLTRVPCKCRSSALIRATPILRQHPAVVLVRTCLLRLQNNHLPQGTTTLTTMETSVQQKVPAVATTTTKAVLGNLQVVAETLV